MTREEYLKRFAKITEELYQLTNKKNNDYADDDDAFQNFRGTQHLGLTPVEVGIMVRMSDKMQRAANLMKREGVVKEESLRDTILDLATYSIILAVYLETLNKPITAQEMREVNKVEIADEPLHKRLR